MVRSENFHELLAMITSSDKMGVINFLRGQGININSNSDVTVVYKTLLNTLVSSEMFKNNFINWAETRYNGSSNASGNFSPMQTQSGGFSPISTQNGANLKQDRFSNVGGSTFDPMGTQSGGFSPISTQNGTNLKDDRFANMSDEAMSNDSFDPMNTQSGGFTPIDTQNGTNLKGDRFLNASGNFDPMNTQSGGFSPISTQSGANLKGDRFSSFSEFTDYFKADTPYDPSVEGSGSGIGNTLRGIDIGKTITSGIDLWKSSEVSKNERAKINGVIKAKEIELQTALANGEITQKQLETQLAIVKAQNQAPTSNVILYVVGGVVLLAGIGTAIFFATRKK